jgi:hypothetical protein
MAEVTKEENRTGTIQKFDSTFPTELETKFILIRDDKDGRLFYHYDQNGIKLDRTKPVKYTIASFASLPGRPIVIDIKN